MSGGSDKSKTGKYGILGVWKFGCFFFIIIARHSQSRNCLGIAHVRGESVFL